MCIENSFGHCEMINDYAMKKIDENRKNGATPSEGEIMDKPWKDQLKSWKDLRGRRPGLAKT